MPQIPAVTVAELPADALLLDVREDDEWAAGHVDGALHVPMQSVPQRAEQELPRDGSVYVVCKVGGRSAQVTAYLRQLGFDAHNVEGGMLAWEAAGRPMVSDTGGAPSVR